MGHLFFIQEAMTFVSQRLFILNKYKTDCLFCCIILFAVEGPLDASSLLLKTTPAYKRRYTYLRQKI